MTFAAEEPAEQTTPSTEVTKAEKLILDILSYKRPHKSDTEEQCLNQYVRVLQKQTDLCYEEREGGIIIMVPGPDKKQPTTLFSCHTDTVHWADGMQKVEYDLDLMWASKADTDPLGADNGAGMFVLLHMIEQRVPGCYMFHRGEERGCIGSKWFAKNMPDFLKTFNRAVAFDRRGHKDVITSQRGTVCCSSEFATALAAGLNELPGFEYRPDPTGIWTDTASYMGLIPECTNVSVGYANEHSARETLDVGHVILLATAACRVDWEALPTKREPKEPVSYYGGYNRGRYMQDDFWNDDEMAWWGVQRQQDTPPQPKGKVTKLHNRGGKRKEDGPDTRTRAVMKKSAIYLSELAGMDRQELLFLVWNNSSAVADLLHRMSRIYKAPAGE